MTEKCDDCEFLDIVELIHENPIWDRIFYDCRRVEEWDGMSSGNVICIRKLGRIEGPDEPWDPIPEIKMLLGHACISDERRAAGLKWRRRHKCNNGKLQKALRGLRIKINKEGGIPVLRPVWCPLGKEGNG